MVSQFSNRYIHNVYLCFTNSAVDEGFKDCTCQKADKERSTPACQAYMHKEYFFLPRFLERKRVDFVEVSTLSSCAVTVI
jgi:hypothetical protein